MRSPKTVQLEVPIKINNPKTVEEKFAAFKEREKSMYNWNPPKDPDQTVPVRAHWRRQKNHLNSNPELKKLVLAEVRRLISTGNRK